MADNELTALNSDTFPVSTVITNPKNPQVFHYVNGLDVDATFTIRGTYQGDSAADDAAELGSTTVTAGSADFAGLTEEWDLLELEIDATGAGSGQADIFRSEARTNR